MSENTLELQVHDTQKAEENKAKALVVKSALRAGQATIGGTIGASIGASIGGTIGATL
jgi:hypothetical protein